MRSKFCARRAVRGALVMFALGSSVLPAFAADQNVIAADNGEVRCTASMRDLTRISLKDDEFASVSKVSTGIATEDFSVVNEPVRGDIYLSVPDGFSRKAVSFFGTTRKGFVYKFVCSVAGDEAVQVFIANADLENPAKAAAAIPASLSTKDGAVRLVKAMYEQSIVEGFEIRQRVLAPVNVGALRVQVIGEYRGPQLTGKTLRIENKGSKPATLTEESVSSSAIAVSIANPNLKPGEATTAYVVQATGEDQ